VKISGRQTFFRDAFGLRIISNFMKLNNRVVRRRVARMGPRLRAGDKAKRFSLPDQHDKEFRLSGFRGKRVLLSFHPLAWTSVCAEQMKSLEKNKDAFESTDVVAVGVSVDTVPSKKAWAQSLGIEKTRLLSDFWPHGKVAKAYGIFRKDDGISERANVIVDEKGIVALFKVYRLGELPNIVEILDFLARMPKLK
jgi:peroxiredoxin